MANITLNDLTSSFGSQALLNENFTAIETALNNDVLYKTGAEANAMKRELDMDGNKIINQADGVVNTDGVTVAQLNGAIGAASSGLIASQTESQKGSEVVSLVTTFVGIVYTIGANNLEVYRNGNRQSKTRDYTETSTSTITWLVAPNATDDLDFRTNTATTNSVTTTAAITHTVAGSAVNLSTYLLDTQFSSSSADASGVINSILAANGKINIDGNITISNPILMKTGYSITTTAISTSITCTDGTKNALEYEANSRNTLVEGISFNGVSGAGNCFEFDTANGGEKHIIRDCYVNNFNRAFNAGNIWWGNRIDNVRVNTCVNSLYIDGNGQSIENLITNFYSNNSSGIGVFLDGVKGVTFDNLNMGTDFVGANQYMVLQNNATGISVIGGNFESSGSMTISPNNGGILVQSGSSLTLIEPTFVSNTGASATGYEIRIKNTARVSVKNPTFVTQGANMGNFLVSDTAVLTTEGYTGVIVSTSTAQQVHLNNMADSAASYDAAGIVLSGKATAHAAGANLLTGLGQTPVWYMVQLVTTSDALPTVQAHITDVDSGGNIKIRYTNLNTGAQDFSAHDIIWAVR